MSAGGSRDGTQSIERAVALLRVLAARVQTGCTLSVLADSTGLKKATAHRVLSRLLHEGLVRRVGAEHRYALGSFFAEASLGIPGYASFLVASQVAVDQLAAATACAAVLYLRSGSDAIIVARGGAEAGTGMLTRPGDRRPLLASSGGVAIAARLPPAEQTDVVAANLTSMGQRGAVRLAIIRTLLARATEHGYAWSLGEFVPGVHAVARAVPGSDSPAASMALIGSPDRLPAVRLPEFAELLSERGREFLSGTSIGEFPFPPE
jgi:DNA-binding IclR family transcriptional regulator